MPSSANDSDRLPIKPLGGLSRLALLAALVLVTACASRIPGSVEPPYTAAQLLPATPAFAVPGDVTELNTVDLLGLDDDMRAFLADVEQRSGNRRMLMVNLLKGLLDEGAINLQYHNLKTYTAREAFHAREGNCLSFTNLFVALAREAGLDVHFQEVRVPHNWERQGETWVYNRHINAWVDFDTQDKFVIDFNANAEDSGFQSRLISDDEALAQYHNNMGVFWMLRQRFDLSYLHLREAILLAGEEAYFWTNLGALYHRVGDGARAEAAWLHALQTGRELSASSNLARYYRQRGDDELANYFEEQVTRFRGRNPFYLYEVAESAYYRGDYQASIDALRKAIRIRDNEEQFYRLLGLSYVKTGDTERASEAMQKAAKYSQSDAARRTYSRKLRLLGGEG
jgi:Flp pilus assembly protein TadD